MKFDTQNPIIFSVVLVLAFFFIILSIVGLLGLAAIFLLEHLLMNQHIYCSIWFC